MALKVSGNAVRKAQTLAHRKKMAADYKANPNAGKEKGLYNTTKVLGITKDDVPVNRETSGDGYNVTRDSTGAITGLKIGEKSFQGLNEQQYQQLIKEHKNRPLTEPTPPEITPNATPEELAKIGEYNPSAGLINAPNLGLNEPLTGDILTNIENRKRGQKGEMYGVNGERLPFPVSSLTRFVPNTLRPKAALMQALKEQNGEDWQNYEGEYSNKNNYDAVITDVGQADDDIALAKDMAGVYGESAKAIALYNSALDRKAKAMNQLKMIAAADPDMWDKKIRQDMTALENYFAPGKQKYWDDKEIYDKIAGAVPEVQGYG